MHFLVFFYTYFLAKKHVELSNEELSQLIDPVKYHSNLNMVVTKMQSDFNEQLSLRTNIGKL